MDVCLSELFSSGTGARRSRYMFLRRLTTFGSNWPSPTPALSDSWKRVPHFRRFPCSPGAPPRPVPFNLSRHVSGAFRPLDPHRSAGRTGSPAPGLSFASLPPRAAIHLSGGAMERSSKEPPHRETPHKRRRSPEERGQRDRPKPPSPRGEAPRQACGAAATTAAATDHSFKSSSSKEPPPPGVSPANRPQNPSAGARMPTRQAPPLHRVWEEFSYRRDRHGSRQRRGRPFDFSVLSYNILSQDLLHANSYLYQHCSASVLGWSFRLDNLLRELQQHNADILCLQEVQQNHYEDQIRPALEALGYQCEYKCRTGRKPDGCAVVFKRDRFSLVSSHPVEYLRPGIPVLDRDNVALVLLLRPNCHDAAAAGQSETGATLCVANTHLLYNPRRGDIKLAQLALLLAEIGRVSSLPDGTSCPVMLCGDLNSVPWSALYAFLRIGSLDYQGMSTARVSGQEENSRVQRVLTAPIWPPSLGISQKCRYQPHTPTDVDEGVSTLSVQDQAPQAMLGAYCARIEHSLRLSSAYSHFLRHDGRPEVTTCHSRTAITVDYILYTPGPEDVASHREYSKVAPLPNGRGLQLLSRLGLVGLSELMEVNGLPNQHHSSDHLPLLARFRLCP